MYMHDVFRPGKAERQSVNTCNDSPAWSWFRRLQPVNSETKAAS